METTYALNENENLQEIKRPPRIGFIKTFAGTTPPEGTLLCDGSAVSRDTYSELFDVIGTTWGAGDGSTTFNLPDLRGRWLMGADAERAAGMEVAEGLPDIVGDITFRRLKEGPEESISLFGGANSLQARGAFSGETMNIENYRQYVALGDVTTPTEFYGGDRITMNAHSSNAIYGASQHVTPASVAVLPCIVYE